MQLFTDPEWAKVFWQAASVIVGALVLAWQIRETGKRVRDASARFWWAQFRSERQQMEADVTKIDIKQAEQADADLKRRRKQLEKGIRRVSCLSQVVESRYPDAFPPWFKEKADAMRDSPPVA